jgi:hypothetical protein
MPADNPSEAGYLPKDLPLWLIEPNANPVDSRWQDRTIWKKVVVVAQSEAFARLAAEEWALRNLTAEMGGAPQIGNESPSPVAGFTDVTLYRVSPLPPEAYHLLDDQHPKDQVIMAEAFSKSSVGASPWRPPDV